jgi:putative transport protein
MRFFSCTKFYAMQWLFDLFSQPSVAQSVLLYMLVMALGIWLGKLRIFGISLGVTWVLFVGLFVSFMGIEVNKEIEHFLKDFGLILFVYSIGLQVGPGFFASLKKNALVNNLLAGAVVLTGVVLTIAFMFFSKEHIAVMTGVMSGAVTNTPGLGAAQAAVRDLHLTGIDTSMITLAYAVTYPFGVFGIILTLLLIRLVLGINMEEENERQRKLSIIQSNRPISVHLNLENKGLIGQPLRRLFDLFKEPIVVSRMYHHGEIITPTPDVILAEGDVLLVVASKMQMEMLKLVIGSTSAMNLKTKSGDLISRIIIVTRNEVTHKRLGDLNELHQDDFTFTRLSRAGVEMVPHGDIFLQLGDTVKVVGTEEGVEHAAQALGNSLKRLETPDLAPIFIGVGLGVILGSLPIQFPHMPVPVKIGLAGGPLIVALLLSRFGGALYLNNYTTMSANLMLRELGIGLFLASVGLSSGARLDQAFSGGDGWWWMAMGAAITMIPLLIVGILAYKVFRKTYFEVCGLLSGASTDPPALAFALKMAGNDIPSATYATVYPLTMILRIVAAELLILLFA